MQLHDGLEPLSRWNPTMTAIARAMRCAAFGLVAMLAVGCATLPPGADFPKTTSIALAHPEQTRLGRQFDGAAPNHGGKSAFRLLSVGVDGFLARAQMINAAERTLDLEYFIFRQDETGQLLTDALLHAADRGVRIRVLVDDADTLKGDGQIAALSADPNIDIRIFNPFAYRGHTELFRAVEFAFDASRLDYRMDNKLLVGDDGVCAAEPIVKRLSKTFDDFWNSTLAIPVAG